MKIGSRTSIDSHQKSKLRPLLAERLRQKNRIKAEPLRVVIRLAGYQPPPRRPGFTREQYSGRCQQIFDEVTQATRRLVEGAGGTIREPGSWLTGSLYAEIPPDGLETLLESEEVESVDLAQTLLPETLTR